MHTFQSFQTAAEHTLSSFTPFIHAHRLLDKAYADHLCYKCSSSESFERMRRLFESKSPWMHQAIIAGRRIATIKLPQKLSSVLGPIEILELSDQKPDKSQVEGFDHLEICTIDNKYSELVDHLKKQDVKITEIIRPHHTTHDIKLDAGLILRISKEPLIKKIQEEIGAKR